MTKKRNKKVATYEQKEEDAKKKAAAPKKILPVTARDKERAELYDLAQRCQAQGDEAGFCGYMSALGDIGR